MISRDFVDLWAPKFTEGKYPRRFFLKHLECLYSTVSNQIFQESLNALLHWKAGKANQYVPGERHAPPHTIDPVFNLDQAALENFFLTFRKVSEEENGHLNPNTAALRTILRNMWNSVVIPAYILHLAKPQKWPIIDQHTVRAFLALTKGRVNQTPRIGWDTWLEYTAFFDAVISSAGVASCENGRSHVDKALFAWGKSLKGVESQTQKNMLPVVPIEQEVATPLLWGQSIPNHHIVPTACNVVTALANYLEAGNLQGIPHYQRQNLNDLKFPLLGNTYPLGELLEQQGEEVARSILCHYKNIMGEEQDVLNLPRPIRDIYLVGWAKQNLEPGIGLANFLYGHGFGGTVNAARAIVTVGKSTGKLFRLLDETGHPTDLFDKYFG